VGCGGGSDNRGGAGDSGGGCGNGAMDPDTIPCPAIPSRILTIMGLPAAGSSYAVQAVQCSAGSAVQCSAASILLDIFHITRISPVQTDFTSNISYNYIKSKKLGGVIWCPPPVCGV
jgi:hypothetical protein